MQIFVTILHVFLCIGLMLIILIQPGKSDIASAFGGGAGNQMYGPRAQGHFLGRATTVIALMFMVTSITLAVYSSARVHTNGSDIEDAIQRIQDEEAKKAPTDAAAPAPTEAPAVPSEAAPAEAAPASAPEQVAPTAAPVAPTPPPEPMGTEGTTPAPAPQ